VSLFRRARSQGIADGRAQVLALLRDEAFTATVTEDGEEVEYEIASVSELEDLQVGYSVTPRATRLLTRTVDGASAGWSSASKN
jgi:hypothetical protein